MTTEVLAWFSLSHKPETVSHGEMERPGTPMHLKSALVTVIRGSVGPWPMGAVSQYETSNHLCNRLGYANLSCH
jgi:hypothetical protein